MWYRIECRRLISSKGPRSSSRIGNIFSPSLPVLLLMDDHSALTKAYRTQLRQELRQKLIDAPHEITHPALAAPIKINWAGIKHCTSGNLTKLLRQAEALRRLPLLLAKASYSHHEPDNKEFPRPGVGAHLFNASYSLNEEMQQVWLLVRETPDGLFLYDLDLVR